MKTEGTADSATNMLSHKGAGNQNKAMPCMVVALFRPY